MSENTEIDLTRILAEFTRPEFLELTISRFNNVFNSMNIIEQFAFSEYHVFMNGIETFKARLSRINKGVLFNYISAYEKLVAKSINLHNKYGTTWFKVKYVIFHLLGFAAVGAIAGMLIGLALPFLTFTEGTIGCPVGAFGGMGYVIYQLYLKWDEKIQKIEKVRDHLNEITIQLIQIQEQIQTSYKAVDKTQLGLNDQIENPDESFLEIIDLQKDINTTYDQFAESEQTLLNSKLENKTN